MSLKPLNLNKAAGGLDRRVFIKGLGWVSAGLFLSTLGGCESCRQQIANRPIRRRLRTGSADVDAAIAIYKDAVNQMRALPATDGRSWDFQSGLHGSVNPPPFGTFNFCAHGSPHFFSWHRAYLFYFEQIIQKITGEQDFGLPYWNWNQNPAMHPEFTAAGSPLNHPRNSTTVAGNNAFTTATLDPMFADTNFFRFSSQIEGTPHNTAHVVVGQNMVSGGSPQDPIFWAHHCMVDYCWAKWNIELGRDNTNDQGWLSTSWNHFVDEDGNPVASVTAGTTILMPLLSYQYESSAIGSNADLMESALEDLQQLEARLRAGAEVTTEIKHRVRVAEQATVTLGQPFSSVAPAAPESFAGVLEASGDDLVFASVDWAQLPPTNDFFVRVFLNHPTASAETPIDDPHYAGSFAFFGAHSEGHASHGGKTEFLVNVTETLRELQQSGEAPAGSPITVQLVAVPARGELERPEAELVLEGLDLVVSPILVRSE